MHVPVDLGAFVELAVVLAGQGVGEERRDDGADEDVEGEGEEDFVGVEREGGEA